MRLTTLAAATLLLSAVVCRGDDAPVALVDGVSQAVLVLPGNPEESTKLAAQELTNYVSRITGVILQVKIRNEGERLVAPSVVIGTLDTLKDSVPAEAKAALEKEKSFEASWLGVKDGVLWIVGKEDVSELYGTYHFLESRLGVRWFQAWTKDDPGDWVPLAKTLAVEPFAEVHAPQFAQRRLDAVGLKGDVIPVNSTVAAIRNGFQVFPSYRGTIPWNKKDSPVYRFYAPRNARRLQNTGGGGHGTFAELLPAKKYFRDHPEYYAEINGKRVAGEQFCLSNPDIRRLVAEDIIRRFDALNGQGIFAFGMTDSAKGSCMCANCRALDAGDMFKGTMANVSTRYFKAIGDIAAQVWAKWPNAHLRTWSYSIYRDLPRNVTLDPRLNIQFCTHERCLGHALDDATCVRNAKLLPLLKKWLAVAPSLGLYDYAECSHCQYGCLEQAQAHDLRLYAKWGIMGWKNEAFFSDAEFRPGKGGATEAVRVRDCQPSSWQWLYVTGHLLWNLDLDENALLEEAEEKYYGAAYPAMRKFQALRRKLWNNSRDCLGFPWGDSRTAALLNTPGAKESLLGYLDEAERLAADDRIRLVRVGRDRTWLQRYWIEPNEKLRKLAGKGFRAVRATTPVTVDGVGDEGAWAGAFYTDDFNDAYGDGKPVVAKFKTTVGILRDEDSLYFLVHAKEPNMAAVKPVENGNVYSADGIEIFLYPPATENLTYHFVVNADGTLTAVTDRGVRADKFGATAAVRKVADGWTAEMKVPIADIHPIVDGETWRVLFARNRGRGHWSTGGQYHDKTSYRALEFGSPYLRNGSFDSLKEDGTPKWWTFMDKGSKVLSTNGVSQVWLNGSMYATMAHGALAQSAKPRRLRYAVTAKGPGKLSVSFGRYSAIPDPAAKSGSRQSYRAPQGSDDFVLTDDEATYTGEHEVSANEWNSLILRGSGIIVRSVAVKPID